MSHLVEQDRIYAGGLEINSEPAVVLLERRVTVSPPEEHRGIVVLNGDGYRDYLDLPSIHSTKQKVIRNVIASALDQGVDVTSHVVKNENTKARYNRVQGSFRKIGPLVIGSAVVTKNSKPNDDFESRNYHKYSVNRIGLKSVLGMRRSPLWKRLYKQFGSD